METARTVIFAPEEKARMEIRSFVNEGLNDLQEGRLLDFDEAFDELESRYKNA
jgi:predicted transcriptional regulator